MLSESFCSQNAPRAHGMPRHKICDVYRATTLAKIVYGSPAWWGFISVADRQRLEAFVAKSKKLNLYADSAPSIAAICDKADDTLFRQIITNSAHVLITCFPCKNTCTQSPAA
jgi:hypothetical protein